MPNRKDLPSAVKNVKHRQINSSLFMWKKESPLMVLSYCLKKGEMCFCLQQHMGEPDIFSEAQKKEKPVAFNFYNTERCTVEIVNEMIKVSSSQPFFIDSAAVNARAILGYNSGHHKSQS